MSLENVGGARACAWGNSPLCKRGVGYKMGRHFENSRKVNFKFPDKYLNRWFFGTQEKKRMEMGSLLCKGFNSSVWQIHPPFHF